MTSLWQFYQAVHSPGIPGLLTVPEDPAYAISQTLEPQMNPTNTRLRHWASNPHSTSSNILWTETFRFILTVQYTSDSVVLDVKLRYKPLLNGSQTRKRYNVCKCNFTIFWKYTFNIDSFKDMLAWNLTTLRAFWEAPGCGMPPGPELFPPSLLHTFCCCCLVSFIRLQTTWGQKANLSHLPKYPLGGI